MRGISVANIGFCMIERAVETPFFFHKNLYEEHTKNITQSES